MLRFLTGDEIARAVKKNISEAGPTRLAVAYWGKGAAKRLGLFKNTKDVKILCDVYSLSCNPNELDRLLECKFEIKTINGFHAKVYLTKKRAVIGSANASTNGLGHDADDFSPGLEAAVETTDKQVIKKACEWFKRHWERAEEVDEDLVKHVRALWKLRAKPSLFATLATNPALFKGQPIYLAFFEDDPKAQDDYDAAWKRVKSRYDPEELKRKDYEDSYPIYLDRSGLDLKPGDYIINYWMTLDGDRRVRRLSATGGVWRVKGKLPFDARCPEAGSIIYAEALTSIANMRAMSQYRQLGKVLNPYFLAMKSPFNDQLFELGILPQKHQKIFDLIKTWQKGKAASKAGPRS